MGASGFSVHVSCVQHFLWWMGKGPMLEGRQHSSSSDTFREHHLAWTEGLHSLMGGVKIVCRLRWARHSLWVGFAQNPPLWREPRCLPEWTQRRAGGACQSHSASFPHALFPFFSWVDLKHTLHCRRRSGQTYCVPSLLGSAHFVRTVSTVWPPSGAYDPKLEARLGYTLASHCAAPQRGRRSKPGSAQGHPEARGFRIASGITHYLSCINWRTWFWPRCAGRLCLLIHIITVVNRNHLLRMFLWRFHSMNDALLNSGQEASEVTGTDDYWAQTHHCMSRHNEEECYRLIV